MDDLDAEDKEFFLKKSAGAEKDVSWDQIALAVFYYGRPSTPQNKILAYKWFKIAISHFSARSREVGELIKTVGSDITEDSFTRSMTPKEIAEAERLAKDWIKKNRP